MVRHGVEQGSAIAAPADRGPEAAVAVAAGAAALVGGLGVANGGFFPTSWGVPAAAASAGVLLALIRPAGVGPLERIWLALLAAFAGWTALALVWTDSVPRTVLELERVLLYVAVAGALVLLAGRSSAPALAAGVVGAVTAVCIWNLAVRAAGAGSARGDVARPLGYENGLAILAAVGALLACGLALSAPTRTLRLAAASTLAVLVPDLALASSNGGWTALAVGVVVAVALLRRSRRVVIAAVALVAATVVAAGALAGHGNPRTAYWRAAWRQHEAAPWLGTGPGTYAQAWLRYRQNDRTTQDAHSLYLETLGESGPLGLALLGAALLVPLAGAAAARRDPLVAGATGAYAAFLVHAAVDFDWELPAVTVAGLAAGAIVLLRARAPALGAPGVSVRLLVGAAALAIGGFSVVALVGNRAVASARDAIAASRPQAAVSDANRASSWLPWDSRPLEELGLARLAQGDRPGAAAAFRRAVAKDPREAGLWFELAAATSGAEAQSALAHAHALDPRAKNG